MFIEFYCDFFGVCEKFPEYLKAALGAACVGFIGIWLPQVFGVGYSSITSALHSELPAITLGLLLIAKIVATSLTLGSGGSGGVFAPSLFLGAVAGGFCGTFIHQWFPEVTADSGAYALVTMGAVVAAATHAPISAMLIIFELTQSIDIIPALMAACVISTLVCQLLSRDSIYTIKLRHQGITFFEAMDPNPLKSLYVQDFVDRAPEVIPANASFQQLLDLVVQSSHSQFFVEDTNKQLLGTISLTEVRRLILERDTLQHVIVAGDLVEPLPATVGLGDNLDVVIHLFSSAKVDELAVVASFDQKRLIGVIRERDVINARNQAMLQRDLAGGLSSGVTAVGRGQPIQLGGEYVLQQIPAPPHLFDKSLAETGLRERLGVQVLLLRSGGMRGGPRVPSPSDVIREGDELVVAGSRGGIAAIDRTASFD